MATPLLSICIPTWNRGEILKKSLTIITSDPAFDERTEIVISDNCSDDNTKDVCADFCNRFSNIRYFRNDINIGFANFYKVLSLGKGAYLKLQNDYAYFTSGSLSFIISQIEKYYNTRTPIFFVDNNEINKNIEVRCTNADEYLKNITYWITWITNCGMWKETFNALNNPLQFTKKFLDLVDWQLQISSKEPSILIFKHYYKVFPPAKKGGYNFYKVFVDYYAEVLNYHKSIGNLSKKAIAEEKKQIYSFILYNTYCFIFKNNFTFERNGGLGIVARTYWKHPYAYTIPFRMFWDLIRIKIFKKKI